MRIVIKEDSIRRKELIEAVLFFLSEEICYERGDSVLLEGIWQGKDVTKLPKKWAKYQNLFSSFKKQHEDLVSKAKDSLQTFYDVDPNKIPENEQYYYEEVKDVADKLNSYLNASQNSSGSNVESSTTKQKEPPRVPTRKLSKDQTPDAKLQSGNPTRKLSNDSPDEEDISRNDTIDAPAIPSIRSKSSSTKTLEPDSSSSPSESPASKSGGKTRTILEPGSDTKSLELPNPGKSGYEDPNVPTHPTEKPTKIPSGQAKDLFDVQSLPKNAKFFFSEITGIVSKNVLEYSRKNELHPRELFEKEKRKIEQFIVEVPKNYKDLSVDEQNKFAADVKRKYANLDFKFLTWNEVLKAISKSITVLNKPEPKPLKPRKNKQTVSESLKKRKLCIVIGS